MSDDERLTAEQAAAFLQVVLNDQLAELFPALAKEWTITVEPKDDEPT